MYYVVAITLNEIKRAFPDGANISSPPRFDGVLSIVPGDPRSIDGMGPCQLYPTYPRRLGYIAPATTPQADQSQARNL